MQVAQHEKVGRAVCVLAKAALRDVLYEMRRELPLPSDLPSPVVPRTPTTVALRKERRLCIGVPIIARDRVSLGGGWSRDID